MNVPRAIVNQHSATRPFPTKAVGGSICLQQQHNRYPSHQAQVLHLDWSILSDTNEINELAWKVWIMQTKLTECF